MYLTDAPCFAAGARTLVQRGEGSVENAVAGERVVDLVSGERVLKPVKMDRLAPARFRRASATETVLPVLIGANAFGDAMPHRKLVNNDTTDCSIRLRQIEPKVQDAETPSARRQEIKVREDKNRFVESQIEALATR